MKHDIYATRCDEDFKSWFSNTKLGKFLDSGKPINIQNVEGLESLVKYNNELRADNKGNAIRRLREIVAGIKRAQYNGLVTNVELPKLKFKTTTPNTLEYGVKHMSDLIDDVSVGKKDKNKLPLERFIIETEDKGGKGYLKIKFTQYDDNDYKIPHEPILVLSAEYNKDDTSKQDNELLSRKRLEWRISRLERLVYEKYNRLF